jgi:hypothetical protein
VAQDALALEVVVEPPAQPGPRPREGLVREVEHVGVRRHQPGPHEALDEVLVRCISRDRVARYR